jgi:hypothetical protein
MDKGTSRPPELAVATLALLVTVLVLSSMPPALSMVVAICAALGWCFWLDHHPTT